MSNSIEIKRKFFHMLGIVVIIPYCYLEPQQYYHLLIFLSIAICFSDAMRTTNPVFGRLSHELFSAVIRSHEKDNLFSGISYMILGFLCAYLISGGSPLYVASCLILVFADPLSGVVGAILGRKGIFLRMLCFFIAAIIISFKVNRSILSWQETEIFGRYASNSALLLACITTTIVEVFNREIRINDNFSIPVMYALTVKLCNYSNLI